MTRGLLRDTLAADIAAAEAVLRGLPENDLAGRASFGARINELKDELAELARASDNLASVALFFDGDPVSGSYGIQADFAGKALVAFQETLARTVAFSESGPLSSRGPVPWRSASTMSITNVLRGSFGFLLEETDPRGMPLFRSSLREAVGSVADAISHIMDKNDEPYSKLIEKMDSRVFQSFRGFIRVLDESRASLRMVEGDRDLRFKRDDVSRARDRLEASDITETEFDADVELLGLLPFQRRFELRLTETDEILRGSVGPRISESYLKRIEDEERVVGIRWKATLERRVVRNSTGRELVTYTLTDLREIGAD